MQVRFEMSGGYGGLFVLEPLEAEVDSDALSEAEQLELAGMVRAAMTSAVVPQPSETMPDLMTYKLSIINQDTWEIVLDDRTVPDQMWPLIDFMRARAVRNRMNRE